MVRKFLRAGLCAIAIGFGVLACGEGSGGRHQPSPEGAGGEAGAPAEVVLEAPADVLPHVHVLSDAVMARATVEGDALLFPTDIGTEVTDLHAGDVIVSTFEDGFIRVLTATETGPGVRPQALSGGWLRLVTRVGSFLDVFSNLDVTLKDTLGTLSANASGERLAGNDDVNLTLTQAKVSLTPSVTFRLRIADGKVQTMALELTDALKVTEAVRALAKAKISWSKSKKLWTSPKLHLRFVLGGIPIISTIYFDLTGDAKARAAGNASLEAGSSCKSSIGSRVAYTPDRGVYAEPINELECSPIWQPKLQAAASAQLGLTLGAHWDFFAIGGLALAFRGGAAASAELCPAPGEWNIDLTGKATANASLVPFGISLGKVSTTLFDETEPLASGSLDTLSNICVGADQGAGGDTTSNGSGGAGGSDFDSSGGNDGFAGESDSGGASDQEARAASNGDPHLRTFDGSAYDLQARGELTLVEFPAEPTGLRIQVRQEALAGVLCPNVTLNTAVALGRPGARVAIYSNDNEPVRINGVKTPLVEGQSYGFGGGASLRATSASSWEVTTDDGATIVIQRIPWRAQHHLNVAVVPPSSWRGRVRGLAGDFDGRTKNDLTPRDQTQLATPLAWQDLYTQFADSYRIDPQQTLFDYDDGTSPASYQVRETPALPALASLLAPELLAGVEAICDATGVTDPTLRSACLLDVACSGGDARQAEWVTQLAPPQSVVSISYDASVVGPQCSTLSDANFVKVETLFLPTDGRAVDSQTSLETGISYRIRVSGTAVVGGPGDGLGDAEYMHFDNPPGSIVDLCPSGFDQGVGIDSIDHAKSNRWGSYCASHSYTTELIGKGEPLTLSYEDCNYADNSGELRVELFAPRCESQCGPLLGSSMDLPASSCQEVLDRGAAHGDGAYWIETAAGAELVTCNMTSYPGGWTRLTDDVAATLDPNATKHYLYRYLERWYRSPATKLNWSWASGQELPGDYDFFDGKSFSSFTCSGSVTERPPFGIGCSNGPGSQPKALPIYEHDPSTGTSTVCQDAPFAFGLTPCQTGVEVYVR